MKMELADVSFWLQRFVLEVQKSNGDVYSPDSLYQLYCGATMLIYLNNSNLHSVDL